MHPRLLRRRGLAKPHAVPVLSVVPFLGLGGCQTDGVSELTGSLDEKTEKAFPARNLDFCREGYSASADDAKAALNYGKALPAGV
jgi:hypothetical protein